MPCHLPAACDSALDRIHLRRHVEANLVVAEPAAEEQSPAQQAEALLRVSRPLVTWASARVSIPGRLASIPRVETHVDLVVVKVCAGYQHGSHRTQLVSVCVLDVQAFLKAGIVLLEGVPADRVVQVESEIGEEVEEGAGDEAVGFEGVAVG